MASSKQLNVFLSSTSEDLEDYRAASRYVILDMGWVPRMMEHFGASPLQTVSACQEVLAECNLVVLIVAFRRGWVPTIEQGGNGVDSITALELAFARKRNVPVIALLAREDWPNNLCEDEAAAREWVKKFRNNINLPVEFFKHEDPSTKESERLPDFRVKLSEALVSYRERLLAESSPAGQLDDEIDYYESAAMELVEGGSIPFLGPGIFGDGPLSTPALADALGVGAKGAQGCLATAAEYKEQRLELRPRFLRELRRILEEQTREISCPEVHNLIAALRLPKLVISATYDLLLEKQLEARATSFATICHIVRSSEGQYDGQILILRKGAKPEICLADKVSASDLECVVYKPHGSPLLHDGLDPALKIDTVVITESDHLTFLGRLENQHTQVPTAFSRNLQQYPMLFLGYSLDVWQYRLVMRVFQSIGLQSACSGSLAVRESSSPVEDVAWQKLGVKLIRMNPNAFAKRALSDVRVPKEQASHVG